MPDQYIHVLLVEDNPVDVILLQEALSQSEAARFKLTHVERLAEALLRVEEESFDIILLDLGLPDSQGLGTLVTLRDQAPGLPVVVLTGLTDEILGLNALQEGAQDYLIKGQVETHALSRAIRYAIERQQAQEALETERYRLRTLIDNLPDLIFLKDTQSRFVVANQAVAEFMGAASPEALLDKTDFDFYPQEQATEYNLIEQQIIQSGEPVIGWEKNQFDWQGQAHWLSTIKMALRDKQGQIVGLVGIERDITKRKQAEEEVRRRNRELNLLNQVIAASAAGLEPEAILDITCRELAQTFNMPKATAGLLNEDKTELLTVAEYLAEAAGTQSASVRYQVTPITASPLLQHLLTHKTPIVITDTQSDPRLVHLQPMLSQRGTASILLLPLSIEGNVLGGLGLESNTPHYFSPEEITLAWSVADQVAGALAHTRMTQTHHRLSTVVEQSAESVIVTDTEGMIIYVNPAFERISGYSQTEVIGLSPRILKSDQHETAFYENLWTTISAGQVWRGRIVNKRKDGGLYTEDATITPVRDESGAIVNYVGVQRDVTRELQLEEQYRQSQKMEAIGRLSGGVAHDFNNMLVVITGYSELLLQRHLSEGSVAQKYVEEIEKAGQRAAALTRQLLAFSRQQVLQPQLLNLTEVVTDMEKMLQRLIGEDVELSTVFEQNLGQVKADPGQIEQVILNLAVNARDAMPNGGKLTLETKNVELDETYSRRHTEVGPGPYVMLAVSDTGGGMDAATQARIFEPFFTTKERGKGTGLGLATVYGIVKQSGGSIWVYSELGRGTVFKVYLPRVDEAPAMSQPKTALSALPDGHETVLLVEDEESVRTFSRQVLEMSGYTVLEAHTGSEALGLDKQQLENIHLLITDVIMPGGVNGRELAEKLKLLYPELKVLYISGYTDDAIVHHGVLEPGVQFLQKPFTPTALAQKVRQALDLSAQV